MRRVFLLSPAQAGGERARLLLRQEAQFPLAQQLRQSAASIGDLFAFLSALYFRGKLAYVRAFAGSPEDALVITPNLGLLSVDEKLTRRQLEEFAAVDIDAGEPRYRQPLERDLGRLAARFPDGEVVLLGSVATRKYTEPLAAVLGERLRFPVEFAGRGDMSRGGLLLRAARSGVELSYAPLSGAPRHGPRPPRLTRVK